MNFFSGLLYDPPAPACAMMVVLWVVIVVEGYLLVVDAGEVDRSRVVFSAVGDGAT